MKQSNLDLQIRQRIDVLLDDISALVKTSALNAVRKALGAVETTAHTAGAALTSPQAAHAKTTSALKGRGKRSKRTSEQVNAMAATILVHVRGNSGQRLEEIGKAMKVSTKDMKLPIQKLLGTHEIRTEGAKRGTRYFASGTPDKKAAKTKPKAVKSMDAQAATENAVTSASAAPNKGAPALKAKAHKKA